MVDKLQPGAPVIPRKHDIITNAPFSFYGASAQFTLVFGVRWCSRGMSGPRSNGVLLGRLPQAVQGWSEITDLYLNKFGHPPPGSRVFLWTRQVINGRKDALKRTCADVPPPGKQGQDHSRAGAVP